MTNMMTPELMALAIPFVMVLSRLSGLMLSLPVFSSEVAPIRMRALLAIVLSVGMWHTAAEGLVQSSESALMWAGGTEIVLGVFLGLVVRVAMAAIHVASELVGMQMGFGFARMMDPMTKESSGVISQLVALIGSLLFLSTGAYRDVLRGIGLSMDAVPPGSISLINVDWVRWVSDSGRDLFFAGIKIGAPLVFIGLAGHIVFALLTRVAPQLNVWSLGFLFTIGAGVLALNIYLPFLAGDIRHQVHLGTDNLLAFVGAP